MRIHVTTRAALFEERKRQHIERGYRIEDERMQAAERGLRRAEAARERAGLAAFAGVLGSLRLSSLGEVDNLNTIQEIVVALEAAAPRAKE